MFLRSVWNSKYNYIFFASLELHVCIDCFMFLFNVFENNTFTCVSSQQFVIFLNDSILSSVILNWVAALKLRAMLLLLTAIFTTIPQQFPQFNTSCCGHF